MERGTKLLDLCSVKEVTGDIERTGCGHEENTEAFYVQVFIFLLSRGNMYITFSL
ncbi:MULTISPECIES: hypothetical protein [Metallosphaera]|nr:MULTISPECIES: hypothetical protein [Metallosphaera]WPX07347.1 hypothetical protein SOJ17_001109 [Metallosphaera sedula DSM 5348]BBL47190.1 hypothetical protein MJ1HA_1291 [Metallosphaera sedula]